jgi:hypothetical protein
MSGRFFLSGTTPLFDGEAQPLSTLTFSLTGTATPQDTYTTPGLTVANANPVVSDANGYFGEILLKRERYKVIWKNAAGTTLKTWDPVDKEQVWTRGAGLPSDPHPGQKHSNTSDGHTHVYKLDTAAWLDIGATDAVGNTATVTEQLTGTSASVYATPDSVAGLWQRGDNIASATTISLPSTGGGVFNVTGTTQIEGIGSAQGGRTIKLKFAGVLILKHDGTTFILPGAANITTVAGDTAEFINEAAADASGSNWRCFNYERSSGSSVNMTDFLATQAEQETGTSTTKYVTSGRQHHHDSAAKAWTTGDYTAGVPDSPGLDSYNISSVSDTTTGTLTANFTTSFSSANYVQSGMCQRVSTNDALWPAIRQSTDPTTSACAIAFASDGAATSDPAFYSVIFHGDQ